MLVFSLFLFIIVTLLGFHKRTPFYVYGVSQKFNIVIILLLIIIWTVNTTSYVDVPGHGKLTISAMSMTKIQSHYRYRMLGHEKTFYAIQKLYEVLKKVFESNIILQTLI